MAGGLQMLCNGDSNGKVESLPLPQEMSSESLSLVTENGGGGEGGRKEKREIVLGRNVHIMCHAVTEPEEDDEVTGEREAHMASVLARYRRSLMERTKHHLGIRLFALSWFLLLCVEFCLGPFGFVN